MTEPLRDTETIRAASKEAYVIDGAFRTDLMEQDVAWLLAENVRLVGRLQAAEQERDEKWVRDNDEWNEQHDRADAAEARVVALETALRELLLATEPTVHLTYREVQDTCVWEPPPGVKDSCVYCAARAALSVSPAPSEPERCSDTCVEDACNKYGCVRKWNALGESDDELELLY